MKHTRIDPEAVWQEYASGKAYNARIGLYDRVRQNEDFYLGRQWEGLEAPDLEQPVLNFLKRAVKQNVGIRFAAVHFHKQLCGCQPCVCHYVKPF